MRSVLFGLLQLAGSTAAAFGVYLLLGTAWTFVIVGGLTFLVTTAAEIMSSRAAPPQARPRLAPDELQPPSRVTELPGAPRSRPRKEA